ncbi:ankyrin repeat-containing domain protein [Lineolata rhizophorae]|uniref:Ankyrin repeat-containing domain protein n=1 Tax=Lineolata rhizophorae TaxID=578093 RepID=A0A6A6PET0_9PEZI|nr:ankyrin repeat-containing domain protein [Lineolata rhizophorae]
MMLNDQAFDAFVYQSAPTSVTMHREPLGYLKPLVEEIGQHVDDFLAVGTHFLRHFSVEILTIRLETDRSIISHLLGAAQLWKSFLDLLTCQSASVKSLLEDESIELWTEGASDPTDLKGQVENAVASLDEYADKITHELIHETDALIQKITNLIAIDEAYRSRDNNASIRRLSWITFIFLPLVFASGVFGMNIDLLSNDPPWVYYLYFIIPLCFLVAICYLLLRYRRAIWTWVIKTRQNPREDDIELQALLMNTATSGIPQLVSNANATTGAARSAGEDLSLLKALSTGAVDAALELLGQGRVDVNDRDAGGATALHHAAGKGLVEVTRRLLLKGSSVEQKDRGGRTPIDWAIASGSDACLALVLFHKIHPLALNENRQPMKSAMHYAAVTAEVLLLDAVVEAGFSREDRDEGGRTPLFAALETMDAGFFNHCIGVFDSNAIDHDGMGIIHYAVALDFPGAVSSLLAHGANVNARDSWQQTPIMCFNATKYKSSIDILELLVEHGADLNAQDMDGNTLCHHVALGSDRGDIVQFIISNGGIISIQNRAGSTPHHLAAGAGNAAVLKLLVDEDPFVLGWTNNESLTPIELAARNGHIELVYGVLRPAVPHDGIWADRLAHVEETLVALAIDADDVARLQLLHAVGVDLTAAAPPPVSPATPNIAEDPRQQRQAVDLDNDVDAVLATPFGRAVVGNREAATAYLLGLGCSASLGAAVHDGSRRSLLQVALDAGAAATTRLLLDAGAPVEGVDSWGSTVLHAAAQAGDVECARRIVSRMEAEGKMELVSSRDSYGWTPLDLAAFYRHPDVEELLHPGGEVTFAWERRPPQGLSAETQRLVEMRARVEPEEGIGEDAAISELPIIQFPATSTRGR